MILHHVKKEDVEVIARKLLEQIERVFSIRGHEHFISASIGVSMFPEDAIDRDQLLKNADQAMYQAKQSGKNGFVFWDEKTSTDR